MDSEKTTMNLKLLPYLRGLNVLENNVNNETLWAWSFPTVTEHKKLFALRKFADIPSSSNFVYSKFQGEWCYFCTGLGTEVLPMVKLCGIAVWATEFSPEKYCSLSRVLLKKYLETGDPSALLQVYLMVMTTGMCNSDENGLFAVKNFDGNTCKEYNTHLAEIINIFGLETILIYTALLLNKRIVVYDHNLSSLIQKVEILPQFLTHRDFKNSTFPWIHLNSDEIADLKKCSGYIAGCADNGIETRTDLYDVLINFAAGEITVASHAKDAFVMTKTHKDIALFLVQLADSNNQSITAEIARKTQDLLTHLRSLAVTEVDGHKMISMENLKDRQFPPSLEIFLFNLAVAENIMLL